MVYKKVCVHGDIATGRCYSHHDSRNVSGSVVASESYCSVNTSGGYLNVALDQDVIMFNCGHTGKVIASGSKVLIKGRKVVLDGDAVGWGSGNITAVITSSLQSKCESI